jgi:subtilisin family serine protease
MNSLDLFFSQAASGLRRMPRASTMMAVLLTATWVSAQPRPVDGMRGRKTPPPTRETARQLAGSIDVGDGYSTADGPRQLRRLAGVVVIHSANGDTPAKHQQRLTSPGQPLAGYSSDATPAREFLILEGNVEEKQRQLRQPARNPDVLRLARSSGGGGAVNPVFVDPARGLRMLATEQLVVALKPGVNAKKYFGRSWKNVRPVWGATDQFILTLPGATAEAVFAESERRAAHPEVIWAEPDFIRQAIKCAVPNDPYFADFQWHLSNTGQGGGAPGADAKLPAAWDITTGTTNITIAILDDGVELDHPDLAANIFTNVGEIPGNGVDDDANGVIDDVNGYDFFNNLSDPSPYDVLDNHGTAIAGIAAAVGHNNLGVAGAAYGCRILPLKIIEGDLRISDSRFAAALRYAAGLNSDGVQVWRGADVLNISLSFGASSVVNSALVDVAVRGRDGLGCLIMVSAGNGAAAWTPYELEIPSPNTYTLRWEYSKDATLSHGDDTVWIDAITYTDGTTESFQSGGLPAGWTTSPSAPWTNVKEGMNGNRALTGWDGSDSRSLRAGPIGANQTTYLEVTKSLQPGVFRFWAWVSSERNADYFRFYVDGEEINGFRESGVPLIETAVSYPASHAACFAVGASTDLDFRSDYSQYGIGLDFLAPSDGGVATIFTTDRTGGDGYYSDFSPWGDYAYDFGGTSASSPLGAGIAALALSVNSYLYAGEIRALLRSTCDPVGGVTYDSSGRNLFYGSGRLNAGRAVQTARPDLEVSIDPSATIADVGSVTTYSVTVRNSGQFWSGPFTLTNEISATAAFGASTPATTNQTSTRLIFFSFGLDSGEQATYRLTATNVSDGMNILTASVGNVVVDSDPADNIATATNSVFPFPVVSIGDVELAEGDNRYTNAQFTVSLSNPSASVVIIAYATATNTARAGRDFSNRRGKVKFLPGETNKIISVRVVSDARNEDDETFFVNLTAASGATIGQAQGVGTILDDDPLPALAISDVTVKEGNSGAKNAVFKLRLSAPSGRDVAVSYATASGSALAETDFISTNGVLIFPAGKVAQKITVKVPGDALQESNLTFFVNLSDPVNVTLADDQGVGTIVNNDKPPKLFISDATVAEGDDGTTNALLTVRLFPASGLTVTVVFETTNSMATGGTDFITTNGLVEFAPGETNQTLPFPVIGDTLSESNETFFVRLAAATNALVADALGQVTIVDDDPLPELNIAGALVAEPIGGTTNVDFNVFLSTPSGRTVRVKYGTVAGTARAGADFAAKSGALIFPPGVTNLPVPIVIRSDSASEPDETFSVLLKAPVNAVLGESQADCIIIGELLPGLAFTPAEALPLEADFTEGGFRLRFHSEPDGQYRIEKTEDLSDPASWKPLNGVEQIAGTGTIVEIADPESAARPRGFYRLLRLP